MRKLVILIAILFISTNFVFADSFNSDLNLYCDNKGIDKCDYDFFVKTALIANDLKLSEEQKKQLEGVYNTYSPERSSIQNSLNIQKSELNNLRQQKASLSKKSAKKSEIRASKKALKKIDKQIKKDVRKFLTRTQRGQYNKLERALFR